MLTMNKTLKRSLDKALRRMAEIKGEREYIRPSDLHEYNTLVKKAKQCRTGILYAHSQFN